MKVKMLSQCFINTDPLVVGTRAFSGKLLKRGRIYELPEEVVKLLPGSAKLVDKNLTVKEWKKTQEVDLKEYDLELQAKEIEEQAIKAADKRARRTKVASGELKE